MLLSCHLDILEWIYTLQLPQCQGPLCSKQAISEVLLTATGFKIWLNGWVFIYELCGCGFELKNMKIYLDP